jgi:negative regulator of sigma E activity
LQQEYLDYLQLHALLHWRTGQVAPSVKLEPKKLAPRRSFTLRMPRRLAVAAGILLAVTIGVVSFYYSAQTALASGDVVDRLVQLNIEMTKSRTQDERKRIYDEQIANIKVMFKKAAWSQEDQELAETLLENSHFLTSADDPMTEAERFNEIAEKIVSRMNVATNRKDEKRLMTLAAAYQQFTELGVKANVDRAVAAGVLNFEHKQRVERLALKDEKQVSKLAEILERNPEASRRAIRRILKGDSGKGKKAGKS